MNSRKRLVEPVVDVSKLFWISCYREQRYPSTRIPQRQDIPQQSALMYVNRSTPRRQIITFVTETNNKFANSKWCCIRIRQRSQLIGAEVVAKPIGAPMAERGYSTEAKPSSTPFIFDGFVYFIGDISPFEALPLQNVPYSSLQLMTDNFRNS